MTEDIINWLALVLAVILCVTSFSLIRPANGERPLLIGFMASSLFGVYIAIVRLLNIHQETRSFFGVILCIWLLAKLWAIYATALHTPRPFRHMLSRLARKVFGDNAPPLT